MVTQENKHLASPSTLGGPTHSTPIGRPKPRRLLYRCCSYLTGVGPLLQALDSQSNLVIVSLSR